MSEVGPDMLSRIFLGNQSMLRLCSGANGFAQGADVQKIYRTSVPVAATALGKPGMRTKVMNFSTSHKLKGKWYFPEPLRCDVTYETTEHEKRA